VGLILDSSVVIASERLGQTAYEMLEAIRVRASDDESAISVITVLELASGVVRADTLQRREWRQHFLDV
jgi:predicted nucleic acid-binding protein